MDTVLYRSRLFEVLSYPGPSGFDYERVRRSPGVRVLIADADEERFVLSSEHRDEVGGVDLRLPGGKVIDAVADTIAFWTMSPDDQIACAEAAGRREVEEELGLELGPLQLLEIVPCGATIEWDLYIFLASGWSATAEGPALELGEESIESVLLTADELWHSLHSGSVSEGRAALVVSRYLYPRYPIGDA